MPFYCQRCGAELKTYNPRRKWCPDCRREIFNEKARLKTQLRRLIKDEQITDLNVLKAKLDVNLDSDMIENMISNSFNNL